MTYELRFWNSANECMAIGDSTYSLKFSSFSDAIESAEALVKHMFALGATEIDINDEFFSIIED